MANKDGMGMGMKEEDEIKLDENTRGVCRDYLRNVCKRGNACKYMHPSEDEIRSHGYQTTNYVFCHDFQNSECRRPNCKFVHCSREDEEYYKRNGRLPPPVEQTLIAKDLGLSPTDGPILDGQVPACRDFVKGECKRGNKCKYRHVHQPGGDFNGGGAGGSSVESPYYQRRMPPHPYDQPIRPPGPPNYGPPGPPGRRYPEPPYSHTPMPPHPPPFKRPRAEFFEYEQQQQPPQQPHERVRAVPTLREFHDLEDDNAMLRLKIEDLKKQVQDLCTTNDLLLEQNTRLRKMQAASSVPGPAPVPATSYSNLPPANNPVMDQTLQSLTAEQQKLIAAQAVQEIVSMAINNPAPGATITSMAPASMAPITSIAPASMAPITSIAPGSMGQNLQQPQQIALKAVPTQMVSYPVMSQGGLRNSLPQ